MKQTYEMSRTEQIEVLRLLVGKLEEKRESALIEGRRATAERAEDAIRRQAVRLGYLLRTQKDRVKMHV